MALSLAVTALVAMLLAGSLLAGLVPSVAAQPGDQGPIQIQDRIQDEDRLPTQDRTQAQSPARTSVQAPAPTEPRPRAEAGAALPTGPVIVITLDGIVGPASADYLVRGLKEAARLEASAVVLQMDTPGGLETSMRAIVQAIVASPVPVIGFVAPSGARAASAGTFLLYASHVAAMAPATNVGAATPVAIGGAPGPAPSRDRPAPSSGDERSQSRPQPQAQPKPAPEQPAPPSSSGSAPSSSPVEASNEAPDREAPGRRTPATASEAKAINDAVAYLRSLAELRGRNADWAEQAVRDGASLSATAALDRGVIDVIASDQADLLGKIQGREVRVGERTVRLPASDATPLVIEPDWRTRALGFIANPNIALLLLMVGVYGLLFEVMTPGAVGPGVVGGISLLLGLYALSMLPLDLTGIGLMLLGLVLLIAEAFVPAHGALGLGGVAALVIGAAMLVDVQGLPGFEVGWPILAGLVVAGLGLVYLIARTVIGQARRGRMKDSEAMIGQRAEVQDWQGTAGHVFVHGERWNAVADAPLAVGRQVRVVARDGLTLTVSAIDGASGEPARTALSTTSTPGPLAEPRRTAR